MVGPITIISIAVKAGGFIKDNWKVLLSASLAVLLFPYFIYVIVTSILLPRIDSNILDSYTEAARDNGIDLSVLLSYDTIRYFNDMKRAVPNESVFDFLVIDWRIYEVEEVTKKREEVIFKENIVRQFTVVVDEVEIEMAVEKIFKLIGSGSSRGYGQISQMLESEYFSYSSNGNMTIPKVVDYLNELDKTDQYVIDCYRLSSEEIVSGFTRGEARWYNGLSSMLARMYPQVYPGPDSSSFALIIEKGVEGDYVPSIWPAYGHITGYFGELRSGGHIHKGLDIGTFPGANIYAGAGGKVIYAGWQSGYGNTIMVHHGSGITTLYGHLEKILVRKGQTISRGDVIGLVGSTGISTGPHLHYEIRINGKRVDPMDYLP